MVWLLAYEQLNAIALLNKSSQSYEMSLAMCHCMGSHCVIWHNWTRPVLTPSARQTGTRLTYGTPKGWKAELT